MLEWAAIHRLRRTWLIDASNGICWSHFTFIAWKRKKRIRKIKKIVHFHFKYEILLVNYRLSFCAMSIDIINWFIHIYIHTSAKQIYIENVPIVFLYVCRYRTFFTISRTSYLCMIGFKSLICIFLKKKTIQKEIEKRERYEKCIFDSIHLFYSLSCIYIIIIVMK